MQGWRVLKKVGNLGLFSCMLTNIRSDLGMNEESYDYSQLLSVFYISYILFEIPMVTTAKWIGPGWFIPTVSLGFGIVSICTAFVHNLPQACGVRLYVLLRRCCGDHELTDPSLLGVFEAGMMPGIAYYLSRWYRRGELAFRLSLYIVAAPLAGAFGGLLASAILTLDHFGSLHSWRMIFAIEGIITCCLSIIAFFTLTDRPETARWLTAAEKDMAIARVKSERVRLQCVEVNDTSG